MSFNVLLSLVTVKLFSIGWWGEWVPYMIIFQLSSFVVAWGSSLYLQRAFAQDPQSIESSWLANLSTRVPLFLLVAICLLFLNIPLSHQLALMAWIFFNGIYRFYEALIVYKRKFVFSLLLNVTVSVCFLLWTVWQKQALSIEYLLCLYNVSEAAKVLACWVYFHSDFHGKLYFNMDFNLLLIGFPFFLQGLVGLLQSRIDTYYVAFALNKEELAKYHILISFLLLVKALIDMCLRPFLKNIYRMPVKSLKKLAWRFLLLGVATSWLVVAFLYVVWTVLYGFEIDGYLLLLSYLFILPMYYYATIIYIYYKYHKEKIILIFGAVIVCFNLLLDIVLVSHYGIEGALTTAVIQEWVMLLLCYSFLTRIATSYTKG